MTLEEFTNLKTKNEELHSRITRYETINRNIEAIEKRILNLKGCNVLIGVLDTFQLMNVFPNSVSKIDEHIEKKVKELIYSCYKQDIDKLIKERDAL